MEEMDAGFKKISAILLLQSDIHAVCYPNLKLIRTK